MSAPLDAHRAPGQVRLAPRVLAPVRPLDHAVLPADPARAVLDYARAFGPRATLAKVASRLSGERAPALHACVGVGEVVEADDPGLHGQIVAFLAPRHRLAPHRLVVERALMRPVHDPGAWSRGVHGREVVVYGGEVAMRRVHDVLGGAWCGWSREAGVSLDDGEVAFALRAVERALDPGAWPDVTAHPAFCGEVRERRGAPTARTGAPSCALIGHGHYARTCVLPTLRDELDVRVVHELDPWAIPAPPDPWVWDTAPAPRPGARHDVWWIAGYHGDHAALACEAIARGAVAVVEKPLVTDAAQLDRLLAALDAHPGARVFTGFHKRHARARGWVRRDLGLRGADTPCDVHAIVHEVALPPDHWYLWPSSGPTMCANGCHWLDDFLELNGDAAVAHVDLEVDARRRTRCAVRLDNGALFTLAMSHEGSSRLGVRELVEYRHAGATARLVDARGYVAEGPTRVLRRATQDKHAAYPDMVRAICGAIRRGEPGDPPARIARLWGAIVRA
jgi:hypothetical protein